MRNLFLLLAPVILGLCGCGPGSSRPEAPYEGNAPRVTEARPSDDLEMSEDEMDELDELVNSLLEEEFQNP